MNRDEDAVKAEVRLLALETIVCQVVATLYGAAGRDVFEVAKRQTMEGARKQAVPGLDAAYSDLISAEFEAALERLYSIIQHHLDTARSGRPR